MPITTSVTGESLGSRTVDVTARQVLAYAAGIGDACPRVADDLDPGFMAPPPMCVSLEWPIVSDPAFRTRLTPDDGELRRNVHAVQDSVFHRPIRPGDRLTTTGKLVGVWRRRSGTRIAVQLETTDAAGASVVTSVSESVYRGVDAEGKDCPPEGLPDVADRPGGLSALEVIEIAIAADMPQIYTECADIWNPIHTERAVAKAAGLPDIILHGTATWALAGREIVRLLADGEPTRLKRLSGAFGAMVFPGDTLKLTLFPAEAVDGKRNVFFTVTVPDGGEAIRKGFAMISQD